MEKEKTHYQFLDQILGIFTEVKYEFENSRGERVLAEVRKKIWGEIQVLIKQPVNDMTQISLFSVNDLSQDLIEESELNEDVLRIQALRELQAELIVLQQL